MNKVANKSNVRLIFAVGLVAAAFVTALGQIIGPWASSFLALCLGFVIVWYTDV